MEELTELIKAKAAFADAVRELSDANAIVAEVQQKVNQLNVEINKLEGK